MSKHTKNSIFNCEGSAWLPGLNNVSKYIKYKKKQATSSAQIHPAAPSNLSLRGWKRCWKSRVVGRLPHHKRLKMSFHIIPMYVFSVLFSSEHLKYLHLVWYHLLTLSQEKEAIKTLTVGTSQLHYCMCVCVCVGAVVNDSSQSFGCQDDQSGAWTCSCTLPCRRSRTCEWQRIQRTSYIWLGLTSQLSIFKFAEYYHSEAALNALVVQCKMGRLHHVVSRSWIHWKQKN